MADIDLTTKATVPSGTSLTITVFEDVDGDGSAENVASQAIDDGTNTYTLSGFEANGGSYWIEAVFDHNEVTKTAELDKVVLGGAGGGGQIYDFTGLIEDKRVLIDEIRDGAAPLLSGASPEELDRTAADLVEEIESALPGASQTQKEQFCEALKRMALSERVTRAATIKTVGPTRLAAEATIDFIITAATSFILGKLGTRAVGAGWVRSLYEEIARHLDSLKRSLLGYPAIPPGVLEDVLAVDRQASRATEGLVENNQEELMAIGEELATTAIFDIGPVVAPSLAEAARDIRDSASGEVASVLYSAHMLRDIPNEELQGQAVPAEGIDARIGELMALLGKKIDAQSLTTEGAEFRQTASSERVSGIDDDLQRAEDALEDLDAALEPLGDVELVLVVAALLPYIASIVASVRGLANKKKQLATAGTKLARVSVVLGFAHGLLLLSESSTGWPLLEATQSVHYQIDEIVDYERFASAGGG